MTAPTPDPLPAARDDVPAPSDARSVEAEGAASRWLRDRRSLVLGAVIAVAVAVRIGCFLDLGAGPLGLHRWPESDMHAFHAWAERIVAGDVLSRESTVPHVRWLRDVADRALSADPELARAAREKGEDGAWLVWERWLGPHAFFWEPLYPYLVAATYALAGPDPRWVFAWQMALGVLTSVLVLRLATRLLDPVTGAVAGLGTALYAPLLFYELVLVRETTIVFFSMLVASLFVEALARRRWAWWFAWGLASGAALLLKTTLLLEIAGLACGGAVVAWRSGRWSRSSLAAAAGGLVLALAPLVARNVTVGASPFALAGSGALMFVFTNSPTSSTRGFYANGGVASEILAKADGRLLPTVRATLETHPGIASYLGLLGRKLSTAWGWFEAPDTSNFYAYRLRSRVLQSLPLTFLVVSPLGIAGLFLGWRRFRTRWPLHVLAWAGLVPLVAFVPLSRYRLPLSIAAIPFAALTVVEIVRRANRRRIVSAALPLVGVVGLCAWTARDLPPWLELVRGADIDTLRVFGDLPEIREAQRQGDLPRLRRAVEGALRAEPPDLRRIGRMEPPASPADPAQLEWFLGLHVSYASVLDRTGDAEAAGLQREIAQRLQAALFRAREG